MKRTTIVLLSIMTVMAAKAQNSGEFIKIEDHNIYSKCFEPCDTNGDGIVTYDEAAAATMLVLDRGGRSNIVTDYSFLKYFPNLTAFSVGNTPETVIDLSCLKKLEKLNLTNAAWLEKIILAEGCKPEITYPQGKTSVEIEFKAKDCCAKKHKEGCEKKLEGECAKKHKEGCEKKLERECAKKHKEGCEKKAEGCAKKHEGCQKKAEGCEKKHKEGCQKKAEGECAKKHEGCQKKAEGCEKKHEDCAKKHKDGCEKKNDVGCAKKAKQCCDDKQPTGYSYCEKVEQDGKTLYIVGNGDGKYGIWHCGKLEVPCKYSIDELKKNYFTVKMMETADDPIIFVDEGIKDFCLRNKHIDADKNGEVSWIEAHEAKELSLMNFKSFIRNIKSYEDLKYFPSLKYIHLGFTYVEDIDLSCCPNLKEIDASDCRMLRTIILDGACNPEIKFPVPYKGVPAKVVVKEHNGPEFEMTPHEYSTNCKMNK